MNDIIFSLFQGLEMFVQMVLYYQYISYAKIEESGYITAVTHSLR